MSFAFPLQTPYLGHDAGLDETRSRGAEARDEAWPLAPASSDHAPPGAIP
jgi:hypothetical protein